MNRLGHLYLILVSIWWAWTVLIDFVVVRTVFASIDNFFLAGELGMTLFSKLNGLELIVASAIVSVLALKRAWRLLIFAVFLWLISMSYFVYLTPKIIQLTELWRSLDSQGLAVSGSIDVQQEHQFYHQLYIRLDGIKLLTLTGLLSFSIWKGKP